jgi:thiamine biosynthesis lipoprotein
VKRLICGLLACLLLCGCSAGVGKLETKQYTASFLTLFDTVTTVKGPAESEEAFRRLSQSVHDELLECHQLFDIYNDYEGINNLKTVNDAAGIAPVEVDRRIIDLLLDCRSYYEMTNGRVNVAMGSVLQLWHEARNDSIRLPDQAYLPEQAALEEAAKHTDFSAVIIDEAASTVYLADPAMRLDVGAIAKGWSAEYVADRVPEGLLLSVGGNVRATGPKDEKGSPWVVGVQDPKDPSAHVHTLYLTEGSLVTSGDYQRTYGVDGVAYHHIIDPDTLYPSAYWSSVTIVCEDSGLADTLSTALFLLDQQSGQRLLEQSGAEALWIDREGNCFYSPGFQDFIRT